MLYTTRTAIEDDGVTLPAGAAGDRIAAQAERDVDDLLGPWQRDATTGLKWAPSSLYDWQAEALERAVIEQARYLAAVPRAVEPQPVKTAGPDFTVEYDGRGAAPKVGPLVLAELERLGDVIRGRGARARP